MKWKGRRQSNNVEDRTRDEIGELLRRHLDEEYTGGTVPGSLKEKKKKVTLPDKVKIPPKRPPDGLRAKKVQVTPGKWTTNNKTS